MPSPMPRYCLEFLSTPSARRATRYPGQFHCSAKFLSTPSARRATNNPSEVAEIVDISIHALREEGDFQHVAHGVCCFRISIHALREEGDHLCRIRCLAGDGFLSTPSARRATNDMTVAAAEAYNFYPRPPRGGRLVATWFVKELSHFYPRPPRGGRHFVSIYNQRTRPISIHALREEGDRIF